MNTTRGQVLPLFAIFLIGLFAAAALAVDVSSAYSARQAYRTAADAASLAGAQDLQEAGSRVISSGDQTKARADSLQSLKKAFGATSVTGAACDPTGQIRACQLDGTPFLVSVVTPSPTCVTCDSNHSVQVSVSNPRFQLTFARILGFADFNVASTSVAGVAFGKSYAIRTLRPPKKLGSTFDVTDIDLDGGTQVVVSRGDVGTNANMNYSGAGSGTILSLNSDYNMYFWPAAPPDDVPQWGPPYTPTGVPLTTPLTDPVYRYPDMTGSPLFGDARVSQYTTLPAVERGDEPGCAAEIAKIDTTRYAVMATQDPLHVWCYSPGTYETATGASRDATISVAVGDVALLKPGAYYLKSGLDVSGTILGGYWAGHSGVALMLDESGPGNCSTCVFTANGTVALNAGDRYPASATSGTPATAAIDWAGLPVQTSGIDSPNPPILMTLLVRYDDPHDCVVPPTTPVFKEPTACDAGKNKTLQLAGGGNLALEGIQYAPADNVEIHGGSSGFGRVGQIIAWTLFYSGGTHINQEGPSTEGPGTLRLDAACTLPGVVCNP